MALVFHALRAVTCPSVAECHSQGKDIHVWVDETRPRLQGARLSAWELMRVGVPMHLIADNAAGLLMLKGKVRNAACYLACWYTPAHVGARDDQVDVVLFGADRVAANGDVVNKIGTYKVRPCAHRQCFVDRSHAVLAGSLLCVPKRTAWRAMR